MAELAVGGPQATDLFGLNAKWVEQSSNNDDQAVVEHASGATGDIVASQAHGEMNRVSATYIYNDTTDIWPDTAGAVLMPRPGQIRNSWMIDGVAVAYSNTGWPTVTVNAHNHDTNAHDTDLAVYSPSITLSGGFGCPELLSNATAASAPVSANYSLSAEHVEADNGSGDHLAGATLGGKEEISLEHVGTPSLTTSGWYVTSVNASDDNADFDATTTTAEKPVTRDT